MITWCLAISRHRRTSLFRGAVTRARQVWSFVHGQPCRRNKGSADAFSSAKAKKMGWLDALINYNVAFGSEVGFKLKCWIPRHRNVL